MDKLKRFVFDAMLAENSLDQLTAQGITVRGKALAPPATGGEELVYSPTVVFNAARMAGVYTAFFCLENAVRALITERLLARKGTEWWDSAVPEKIRNAVEKLREKEAKNKYHTQRSTAVIGYTMFGNLAQIIIANWEDFSDLFPDQAWVNSRFNDLEMSRNVIMHTGVLPPIEIERIESIARDWLRQVG
jgi:hypothetical protein